MTLHRVKLWREFFEDVRSGRKKHEIRKDDRGYQVGDFLVLMEFDEARQLFTGREQLAHITYKTPGGAWGLPADTCVLSIQKLGGVIFPRGLHPTEQ